MLLKILPRSLFFLILGFLGCLAGSNLVRAQETAAPLLSVHPAVDLHAVIRNPAMGWVLYIEGTPPPADKYWKSVAPYVKTASILYLRLPWAYLEPKEGQYAWNNDANFQSLLQGARARGLQLAFRVVANSKDGAWPGAPDYVRDAGAAGYEESGPKGQLWTPRLGDPVFRTAFAKFIRAFGQEFDNPAQVAYIDGGGVGWWGEMHHTQVDKGQLGETLHWLCSTYAQAFTHVLLGIQLHSELSDWGKTDAIALQKYGYVARIDSLGSFWFGKDSRDELHAISAETPFYGESCYFSLLGWNVWKNPKNGYLEPRDVLVGTMKDALENHANTLDLRQPGDAATWFKLAPDLVQRFVEQGGYRLAPTAVTVEAGAPHGVGHTYLIHQTWQNFGVGFLPDDNPRWNGKYRVAFALLPQEGGTPTEIETDSQIDPGSWKGGSQTDETSSIAFHAPPGTYRLALAIVDTTRQNQPAITLALNNETASAAWHVLGQITIP